MTIIGITLDWEDSPTYSSMHPWYALRCNYPGVISSNGAIPILIPYDFAAIKTYASMIDALLIPGGDYDLDPSVYGEEKQVQTRIIKNKRSEFEIQLVQEVMKQRKPILGICAGEQLLAAMHGGKLIQDIKTFNPDALQHEQKYLDIHMSKPSHKIKINQDSLLYSIVETQEILVNSSHHQAVKQVGDNMIISAVAPDGIVEAIEMKDYPFMLGVEWHPEYEVSSSDQKIIKAFIKAASKHE
jgi:putative glutamine amidotransferase